MVLFKYDSFPIHSLFVEEDEEENEKKRGWGHDVNTFQESRDSLLELNVGI